jgi:hypothetical protein
VYAVTHNIVLSYNLLFLSTFVLSGLGTFLLVRALTGSARAAFVAGVLYGFAPYRTGQFSHLQVLSSQWMPFALYFLHRYFDRRSAWALAGAALALVAQNWSCGYYLLYFTPVAVAYVLYEIAGRGLWRSVRTWAELAAAAAAVAAASVPFLLPYLAVRGHGFGPRPLDEVARFSADVYSYLTAHSAQSFWGAIAHAFPKAEGELFPAAVPVVLAIIGLAAHARVTWAVTRSRGADPGAPSWRRAIAGAAALVLAWQVFAVLAVLVRHGIDWRLGPLALHVRDLGRALQVAFMAAAVLLAASRRARAFVRGVPLSAVAFFAVALVAAFWLSLGPVIVSKGVRVADGGVYTWLYRNVPGFDGLRVPARMGMIVALCLAVLGGYGARAIERWLSSDRRRAFLRSGGPAFDSAQAGSAPPGGSRGAEAPRLRIDRASAVLAVVSLLFLIEVSPAPIEVNGTWPAEGLAPPPVPLIAADGPPAIYRAVRTLPPGSAIAEFPFGDEQYDLRYMVWSAAHGLPLLNGYSGGFPRSYAVNRAGLGRVLDDPDTAWRVLSSSGATHATVHEGAYLGGDGAAVCAWLRAHGAKEVASSGRDRLFELPPPRVARICPPLHEM